MTIRPSSLPMLAQCPCFESDSTEFAEDGTRRHKYLAALLRDYYHRSMTVAPEPIDDESREAVEWAFDHITMLASGTPDIERKICRFTDDFEERSGTPDAVCKPEFWDFKWRERNYDAQVADYGLMLLESWNVDTVICYVLFGATRRIQKHIIDRESAHRIVDPILAAASNPNRQPTPCDYCGWCAKRLSCEALTDRVQAIADGREDWRLEQYHASKIETPAEAFKARKLAKQVIKWAEGVLYHTEKIAEKLTPEELKIHGYKWQPKRGRQYCADVLGAYNALGLTSDEFLKACDLRLNTSKTYPDKKGITELFAERNDMKTAPAKRAVLTKLESVLKRGEDTRSLVEVGKESTDEN